LKKTTLYYFTFQTVDTTTTDIANSVSPTATVPVSVDTFTDEMTSGVTSEVPQEVTFESTTYQPIILSVDTAVVEITTEYVFLTTCMHQYNF
jgi:hypothetical protein